MIRLSLSLPSLSLLRPVEIEVAFPQALARIKPPFRCLWALHCAMKDGKYLFDNLGLFDIAERANLAVVAPALGNGYFVNSGYEMQGDFLPEMLINLQEIFPLSRDPADNAVLGISMGGFGAMRWALESGSFASAAAISGVFDCHVPPDERLFKNRRQKALHLALEKTMCDRLLEADGKTRPDADLGALLEKARKNPRQIELFCGADDYISLPQTRYFCELCLEHGLQANLHVSPGGHEPSYWRQALNNAVNTLFCARKLELHTQ